MLADVLAHYGLEARRESGEERVNAICHEDAHKSASVNWDEELYFCHTCSWGGDAIAIVSRMESLTYRDAFKFATGLSSGGDGQVRGGAPRERGRFELPRSAGDKRRGRTWLPAWRR